MKRTVTETDWIIHSSLITASSYDGDVKPTRCVQAVSNHNFKPTVTGYAQRRHFMWEKPIYDIILSFLVWDKIAVTWWLSKRESVKVERTKSPPTRNGKVKFTKRIQKSKFHDDDNDDDMNNMDDDGRECSRLGVITQADQK